MQDFHTLVHDQYLLQDMHDEILVYHKPSCYLLKVLEIFSKILKSNYPAYRENNTYFLRAI